MIKKVTLLAIFSLLMFACNSSKSVVRNSKNNFSKADEIIANALKYKGVKYKYGGVTKKGMDCSGVIYVAFGEANLQLPRVSKNMAKKGIEIPLKEAKRGDLLFFKTKKNNKNINHVGLIIANKNGNISFIHATTSRGVIISSLAQKYWQKVLVKVTSVL